MVRPSNEAVRRAGEWLRSSMQASPGELDADAHGHLRVLEEWRQGFAAPLHATTMGIRSAVQTLGFSPGEVEIKGRHKKRPAITAKLLDKPHLRLPQMEDVAGARVILPTQADVYRLRDRLETKTRAMTLGRTDDYVERPRAGGYRAVHLHAKRLIQSTEADSGSWRVEIQLRTPRQHQWADRVEELDSALRTDAKHEAAPDVVMTYLRTLASLWAANDRDKATQAGFDAFETARLDLVRYIEEEEGMSEHE